MKIKWMVPLWLIGLLFASCNPSTSATGIPVATLPSQNDVTQMPVDTSDGNPVVPMNTLDVSEITPPAAEANEFVKMVEDDLAARLNIGADRIHFQKMTDIDWQDLSQGCTTALGQTSTKGRLYGYRIWLEANGKNYLYHVGLDNTVLSCPE